MLTLECLYCKHKQPSLPIGPNHLDVLKQKQIAYLVGCDFASSQDHHIRGCKQLSEIYGSTYVIVSLSSFPCS